MLLTWYHSAFNCINRPSKKLYIELQRQIHFLARTDSVSSYMNPFSCHFEKCVWSLLTVESERCVFRFVIITSCSKAEFLQLPVLKLFHHEFIITKTKLWRHFFIILKAKIWWISKTFLQSNSLLEIWITQIFKLFIMNLSLEQESSEDTSSWIWKPNFDEFQRFFTVKPLARKPNFCKYSKFSSWIYH